MRWLSRHRSRRLHMFVHVRAVSINSNGACGPRSHTQTHAHRELSSAQLPINLASTAPEVFVRRKYLKVFRFFVCLSLCLSGDHNEREILHSSTAPQLHSSMLASIFSWLAPWLSTNSSVIKLVTHWAQLSRRISKMLSHISYNYWRFTRPTKYFWCDRIHQIENLRALTRQRSAFIFFIFYIIHLSIR